VDILSVLLYNKGKKRLSKLACTFAMPYAAAFLPRGGLWWGKGTQVRGKFAGQRRKFYIKERV
jgi:hypothetical protein